MHLLIYATKDSDGDPRAPTLFVQDRTWAALPFHPDGGEWEFLRAASADDPLVADLSAVGRRAVELMGFYILER